MTKFLTNRPVKSTLTVDQSLVKRAINLVSIAAMLTIHSSSGLADEYVRFLPKSLDSIPPLLDRVFVSSLMKIDRCLVHYQVHSLTTMFRNQFLKLL